MLMILALSTSLLAGLEASRNLGEAPLSAVFQAVHGWSFGDGRAMLNTSDKVESQAGYILGAELDIHERIGPLLGAGYRYRDGGDWVKHSAWARVGLALDAVTAVLAWDLTSQNRVRVGELRGRWLVNGIVLEHRLGLVRYDGAQTGGYLSLLLGGQF